MTEENFQKKLGSWMVILGWILILGLLSMYFSKYLDKQHNPNQDIEFTQTGINKEIELQRNRYGHYVADGKINNQAVVFILDTGATDISIPEQVAQRLKLRAGMKFTVNTANGEIAVYGTRLDSVSLGPITLQDVNANINPYFDGEEILLGMSFLKHLHFSQHGDKLLIRQY